MKRLKIIVCGVTFGKMYIKAIAKNQTQFHFAGILSTGSNESKTLSKQYRVPLFLSTAEIPADIDIACVVVRSTVVGGGGTELALDLLEKGIAVIQEQPVHYTDMVKCLQVASKKKTLYYLNNFYRDLTMMQKFFEAVSEIKKNSKIISIEATTSIQVLFPMIDILGDILEGFGKWNFSKAVIERKYPFDIISGNIHNIPVLLQIQNQINSSDPDNDSLVLHRIVVYYEKGTLIMAETNGCIIWIPRVRVLRKNTHNDIKEDIKNFPAVEIIYSQEFECFEDVYAYAWPESTERTLKKVSDYIIQEGTVPSIITQRQMSGCRLWNDLGSIIGPAEESPDIIKYKGSFCFRNGQQ